MCRVLQQEGSQLLSQVVRGGVRLTLSKADRAHPTQEVVLEERRESLTKDKKGRGVLGLQGGRSGRRRRGFNKLRALARGVSSSA